MNSGPRLVRITAAAGLAAWLLVVAALVRVLLEGPIELPGLTIDRLTGTLAVLVVGLTALIAVFSTRYLQDDPRLGRHLGLVAGAAAGTLILATADSLALLTAGWIVAGAALCGLLARSPAAGGRTALRRTAAAFAVGDAALLLALGLTLAAIGNLDLTAVEAEAARLAGSGVADAVAVLLVLAALARCAQLPFHRWLPATVAAPTPVSALLHAGLVNAGGILLVRLGPVVGLSSVAVGLLLAAGGATTVWAAATMLTRPDVKGALAVSTAAQMGFMLVQVALGATAAAVVHLVGHAMFKATLFLGAGSAVAARRRRHAIASGRAPLSHPARVAAALALPAVTLGAAIAVAGGADAIGGTAALVLLAFAWAAGAHAVDGWLRGGPPAALAAAAAAIALASAAYVGLLAGGKAYLAADLPALEGAGAVIATPLATLVVLVTALRLARPAAAVPPGLYAWLVDAGWVTAGGRARRLAPPRRAPLLAPRPATEVAS